MHRYATQVQEALEVPIQKYLSGGHTQNGRGSLHNKAQDFGLLSAKSLGMANRGDDHGKAT
ncbi:hypothetical protein CCMA1212_004299 [Trichoderma ghanense]|uniref:Uncharacterized protein n=1 Tax=Trichoderma ghanense TaxID=65468 RepID=A0ABY2H4H1_9HYPO